MLARHSLPQAEQEPSPSSTWLMLRTRTSGVVARARPLHLPGVAEVGASWCRTWGDPSSESVARSPSSSQASALLLDPSGRLPIRPAEC
jgi:hypothetical protein